MRGASKQATITSLFLVVMIIGQLAIFALYGDKKTSYHVDELYTYGLSNSYDAAFLYEGAPADGLNTPQLNHWLGHSVFLEYLTVQQGEGFAYDRVYYNQTQDVHPPLYYILIHTICSFFPNTFSKWFGLGLNFVLFALCQVVLYKLSIEMLKTRGKSLLVCALWGFGVGALNTVLFIRMYALLTLFVLLSFLIHVKITQTNKIPIKYILGVIAITILGDLTQYYFYIYSFLLAVVVGIFFVKNGSGRNLFIYSASAAISFLISITIFPAIFVHFNGYRGDDAVNGMMHLEISGPMLRSIYSMINQELFGLPSSIANLFAYIQSSIWFVLCIVIPITILVVFIFYISRKSKKIEEKSEEAKSLCKNVLCKIKSVSSVFKARERTVLLIMFGITLLYIWIISNIAPDMGLFMDRYVFCIFPFICILAVACLSTIFSKLIKRTWLRNFTLILLIAIFVSSSHWNNKRQYLYSDNEPRIHLSSAIAGTNCIFVTEHDYLLHSMSNLFMSSDNVYSTRPDDVDQIIKGVNSAPGNSALTLIISANAYSDMILQQIEDGTDFSPLFLSIGLSGDEYYYIYELQEL